MKKIFTLLLLSSAWLSNAQTNFDLGTLDPAVKSSMKGYWDFENAADLGASNTVGSPLVLVNPAGFSQTAGPNSTDKAIFKSATATSMTCTTSIPANGGGTKTNQYSIMFDFMVPAITNPGYGDYNCLLNLDNGGDGELYLQGANPGGSKTFGYYTGPGFAPNQWYRAVFTVDLSTIPAAGAPRQTNLYIDGALYMSGDDVRNAMLPDASRVALSPVFSYYGDSDSEQAGVYMSQTAIFDRALTDVEVSNLGDTVLGNKKFVSEKNSLKVYPNPVNANARISFTMPESSKNASIELIDMNGRVVENIFKGALEQGEQTISWTAKNNHSAGNYIVKLSSEESNQTFSVIMK